MIKYFLTVVLCLIGCPMVFPAEDQGIELSEVMTVTNENLVQALSRVNACAEDLFKKREQKINDPWVQWTIQNRSRYYSFQCFLSVSNHNFVVAEKETLAEMCGFPRSYWWFRQVIAPKDPMRPGILAVSNDDNFSQVDEVVAKLRSATTTALIVRRMRKHLKTRRANAIIVAQGAKIADDGIGTANSKLSMVPQISAAKSMMEAERERSLSEIERAARGGCGARRFQAGLGRARSESYRAGIESATDAQKLVVYRMQEHAYKNAVKIAQMAEDAEKPLDLVGFEVDFYDRWPCGIDYYIPTEGGKTYLLFNIGHNFRDPDEDALPPFVYGSMNVSILACYEENGKITDKDLYRLLPPYNLYPTKEGYIVYVCQHWTDEERESVREVLAERYAAKGELVMKDVIDACWMSRVLGKFK